MGTQSWKTPPPTQPLGHPPVYMLYATLTPSGKKGVLLLHFPASPTNTHTCGFFVCGMMGRFAVNTEVFI